MSSRSKYQLTRDRVLLLLTLGGQDARRLEDTGVVRRQFKVVGTRPLAVHAAVSTAA